MCKKGHGRRVGAILSGGNGVVYFIGYGVYVGKEVPPAWVGGFNLGGPNPKIQLDSGKVVYGCECWWGDEDKVKKSLEQYETIINVDIDEHRAKNAK